MALAPYDFKPHTRDGLGIDWPISYEDVAPYYDKVERLIGVYGTSEGLENTPNSSPGCLLPPPAPLVSDYLVQQRARRLGIPIVPGHRAVLTQQLDFKRSPALLHPGNLKAQKIIAAHMQQRAACIWATDCGRGCSIRANYQSTTVHLPPALATGNLDIVCNAMVSQVVLGKNGLAKGVKYFDKVSGAEHQASARVIVLAASACESARILLNSKSALFPNGLANSSGKIGRYIMDTVGSSLSGQIPLLESLPLSMSASPRCCTAAVAAESRARSTESSTLRVGRRQVATSNPGALRPTTTRSGGGCPTAPIR